MILPKQIFSRRFPRHFSWHFCFLSFLFGLNGPKFPDRFKEPTLVQRNTAYLNAKKNMILQQALNGHVPSVVENSIPEINIHNTTHFMTGILFDLFDENM